MNPLVARAIYCVGLCFLAACAVLPDPVVVAAPTPITIQAPPTVAQQLASATRDRVEAMRRYGDNHPAVIKAAAVEATLRSYAQTLSQQDAFHSEFVAALSNELAAAMAQRAEASKRYGAKHPELIRAETLVRELTLTLNTEVRSRG
jgi:uncharacterized protein involved in exopolysaccharide biosynthesis